MKLNPIISLVAVASAVQVSFASKIQFNGDDLYAFVEQFGGIDNLKGAYRDLRSNEPYIQLKRSFDEAFRIGTPDEVPHPDLMKITKGICSVRMLSKDSLVGYLQNAKKKIEQAMGDEKERKIAYYSIMFSYLRGSVSVNHSTYGTIVGPTEEESEKIKIYDDFKEFLRNIECGIHGLAQGTEIDHIAGDIGRIYANPFLPKPEEIWAQRYTSQELPAGDKLFRAVQQPKKILEQAFFDLNNNLEFIKLRSDFYRIFDLAAKEEIKNTFIYTILKKLSIAFSGKKINVKRCLKAIEESEGVEKEWNQLLYGILGIAENSIDPNDDWAPLVNGIDLSKREAAQDFVRSAKRLYDTKSSFGKRDIEEMVQRYTPSRA